MPALAFSSAALTGIVRWHGSLITLNRNFRSVPGVLGAVNEVFAQLMSPEAGEIDYSDGHGLVPHRDDPLETVPVELCLVQQGEVLEVGPSGDEGDVSIQGDGTPWNDSSAEGSADLEPLGLDAAELGLYEREARVVSQRIAQMNGGSGCGTARHRHPGAHAGDRPLHAAALRDRAIAVIEDTGRALFDHPTCACSRLC
jgi:hypothetical protein